MNTERLLFSGRNQDVGAVVYHYVQPETILKISTTHVKSMENVEELLSLGSTRRCCSILVKIQD